MADPQCKGLEKGKAELQYVQRGIVGEKGRGEKKKKKKRKTRAGVQWAYMSSFFLPPAKPANSMAHKARGLQSKQAMTNSGKEWRRRT